MNAVFKADGEETQSRYSISEWWLDPNTAGPGTHAHPEDHIFYVIEGTVSLNIAGEWFHAERGSYALIPGGTPHDFENRGTERCGFMSLNAPGGFEDRMPGIAEALNETPVGDASTTSRSR
jgi:mannose-6-phosphate isomerase-like protein (cupin superfamily)